MRVERIGECTLYLGDCLDVLPTLGPVDAVVTDPPYLMGSASTRRGAGISSPIGDWTNSALWFSRWLAECKKLMTRGSIWACGNLRGLPVFTLAAESVGLHISSHIVWDKNWIGVGPNNGLRQQYEVIFQIGVGDFAVSDRSEPNIWLEPWASHRPSGHPSEKPVGIFERAIRNSDADTILDPFMGSGTTLVACAKLGRRGIGIEIDPSYFDIACRRVDEAYRQPYLFVERPAPPVQEALF